MIGGGEAEWPDKEEHAIKVVKDMGLNDKDAVFLIASGEEKITAYSEAKTSIRFLQRDGAVVPFSQQTGLSEALFKDKPMKYLIYPRN